MGWCRYPLYGARTSVPHNMSTAKLFNVTVHAHQSTVLDMLLKHGAFRAALTRKLRMNLLNHALGRNSDYVAMLLIDYKDTAFGYNNYAIRCAAFHSNEAMVRYLMKKRRVNPGWNMSEAFAWAYHNENTRIMRLLRRHRHVFPSSFKSLHPTLTRNGVELFKRPNFMLVPLLLFADDD